MFVSGYIRRSKVLREQTVLNASAEMLCWQWNAAMDGSASQVKGFCLFKSLVND
jgi:hypothetical protein